MLSLAALLIGCSGDEAVNNPNASKFNPVGTIQGVLVDAVTKDPIVGAVVDIGVTSDTTSETGQFVLENVPATEGPDGASGMYYITVDLRKVTSPVNMKNVAAGSWPYPDFTYRKVEVHYDHLDDSNPGAGTNATNHDTPVDRLVSDIGIEVGKLSASIQGVVAYDATLSAATDQAWTVMLISTDAPVCSAGECSNGPNSATGDEGNVIMSVTTTVGNANFSFTGVEALTDLLIVAVNASQSYIGEEDVESPADGITKILVIQHDDNDWDNRTVLVSPSDAQDVKIVKVEIADDAGATYSDGANIGTSATAAVTYYFSEPIKQDSLTDPSNVLPQAISRTTCVDFEGQVWTKAGNLSGSYSVAWNTTFDALTVTVSNLAAASVYRVDITDLLDATGGVDDAGCSIAATEDQIEFTDNNSNPLDSGDLAKASVEFYTVGGGTLTAPSVAILNNATLDWVATVQLDWFAVSGAKAYNVYRHCDESWDDSVTTDNITGDTVLLNDTPITTSEYGDPVIFIEGDGMGDSIALECSYCVKGVGPDLSESTCTEVVARDNVRPELDMNNDDTLTGNTNDLPDEVTLVFTEPLNESRAETVANYAINTGSLIATPSLTYSITGAVHTNADLSPVDGVLDTHLVTLTLNNDFDPADLKVPYVDAGANGICESTPPAGVVVWAAVGNGKPNATCIVCVGAGCTLNVGQPASNDDTLTEPDGSSCDTNVNNQMDAGETCSRVTSGPDGVCDSTRPVGSTDSQVIAQNYGAPNGVCYAACADDISTGTVDYAVTDADACAGWYWEDAASTSYLTTGNLNDTPATTGIPAAQQRDDVATVYNFLTITNVTDVKGNVINTTNDQLYPWGTSH